MPARSNVTALQQLLILIPLRLVGLHTRKSGVEAMARSLSVRSHLAAMLFAQLANAIGLNDVCDWLRLKRAGLSRFGVTPPSRNTLSHVNKHRDADFVEKLFWSTIAHLQHACPSFAAGRRGKGILWRFKVRIQRWTRQ